MLHSFRTLAVLLVVGLVTTIAPTVPAAPGDASDTESPHDTRNASGTGVQVGARSGIQLLDDDALQSENVVVAGAELRLSFELSPLVLALTFDHFFVEDRTLFQLGANALYDLPIGHSFLYPYVGPGVGVTRFALPEVPGAPPSNGGTPESSDSNGMRMGLNLTGGLRFHHVDVPVVRPFAQLTATVGPIDLLTVFGGVLFELDGR